ncbi:MAG: septation protein A [Rhodospirillaceae bacterium]|nr:septation protein A [Rhodospirillaceae bacterium]|tara:strand:+ start:951 stop:1517 length:567 start_codon:yes stop_codon:yes gene_type:complete
MNERLSAGQRAFIDLGPLGIFFVANYLYGIMVGTAALMIATFIVIVITLWIEREVPPMPAVTCLLVMVFGGLTLYFDNDVFIKLKPTIVNILFALALFLGILMRRNFLKILLGRVLHLTDYGWNVITKCWIGMFLFLAGLNEILWRSFDTDTWVTFKVFGIPIIVLVFGVMISPLLRKHQLADDGKGS